MSAQLPIPVLNVPILVQLAALRAAPSLSRHPPFSLPSSFLPTFALHPPPSLPLPSLPPSSRSFSALCLPSVSLHPTSLHSPQCPSFPPSFHSLPTPFLCPSLSFPSFLPPSLPLPCLPSSSLPHTPSLFPFLPTVDRIRGFAHAAGFAAARLCLQFLLTHWTFHLHSAIIH